MVSPSLLDATRGKPMAEKAKRKWIKKATAGAHGQFAARAAKAGETTREFAAEHAGDSGRLGKQARLAKALMGMHRGAKHIRSKLYGSKD